MRDLLAFLELLIEWVLTFMVGTSRQGFVWTITLLFIGYIAVLVGITLPTLLVFFPRITTLSRGQRMRIADDSDDVGGKAGAGGGAAEELLRLGGPPQTDSATALSADEHQVAPGVLSPTPRRGRSATPREVEEVLPPGREDHEGEVVLADEDEQKYYMLPWNFAYRGTLSSVVQQQKSAEGRIFATCLIINEVCVILSRYTLVLYSRECEAEPADVREYLYLHAIVTEGIGDQALRILWLILPSVLFLITAALPSRTFVDDEDKRRQRTDEVNRAPASASGPASRSLEEEVSRAHEKDTVVWMRALHLAVFFAMGILLVFETRQLVFSEAVDIGRLLFGDRWSEDDQEYQPSRVRMGLLSGYPGTCTLAKEQRRQQRQDGVTDMAEWVVLFRVLLILLGWVSSASMLVLQLVLHLRVTSSPLPGASAGGRLLPVSASLVLPRCVYVAEVLAMLSVFALPNVTGIGRLLAPRDTMSDVTTGHLVACGETSRPNIDSGSQDGNSSGSAKISRFFGTQAPAQVWPRRS